MAKTSWAHEATNTSAKMTKALSNGIANSEDPSFIGVDVVLTPGYRLPDNSTVTGGGETNRRTTGRWSRSRIRSKRAMNLRASGASAPAVVSSPIPGPKYATKSKKKGGEREKILENFFGSNHDDDNDTHSKELVSATVPAAASSKAATEPASQPASKSKEADTAKLNLKDISSAQPHGGPYTYSPYYSLTNSPKPPPSVASSVTTSHFTTCTPLNSNAKVDCFGFIISSDEEDSSEEEEEASVSFNESARTQRRSNTSKSKKKKRRDSSSKQIRAPAPEPVKTPKKHFRSKRISNLRNLRVNKSLKRRAPTPAPAPVNPHPDREAKWIKMMRNWERYSVHKNKKVIRRVRKGIPNSLRGAAWSLMGNVPNSIDFRSPKYRDYLTEASKQGTHTRDTIERDIHRTFPKHSLFATSSEDVEEACAHRQEEKKEEVIPAAPVQQQQLVKQGSEVYDMVNSLLCQKPAPDDFSVVEEKREEVEPLPANHLKQGTPPEEKVPDLLEDIGGQASLRRVLRAYSVMDKEVGYCQGMNFITAMFITFMTEEEAFWLLVAVMNNQPCKMRNLFGEGMSQAQQVLHVASRLIEQFLPKLAAHFERENVHITMFATQWLLTIYTSSFPFNLVTRVWDCFLLEGWKVVYRVMLALLELCEEDLLSLSFEKILGYFRDVLPMRFSSVKKEEVGDYVGDLLLKTAYKIPLKTKHIVKYEREWLDQMQSNNQERR